MIKKYNCIQIKTFQKNEKAKAIDTFCKLKYIKLYNIYMTKNVQH